MIKKVMSQALLSRRKNFAKSCFVMLFMFSFGAQAEVFTVGPNQDYEDLNEIPWLNLVAGDEVVIHHRDEPYRTKIGLRARGTANAPIIIRGVSSAQGERPEITGKNAITPEGLRGFFSTQWDEHLGTIIIKRGPDDSWGYKPGHIIFDNLKITGGHPDYQYTSQEGDVRNYGTGSAGIWAVLIEDLIVRNSEIHDNANGVFVLSKNNAEEETSRDILIEKSHFSENGIAGSFREHNLYLQAANVTYQHNVIERLRVGAQGSSLKDRSANTVVRYNWIEPSSRAIDLVDPEDSYQILTQEPGYNDTHVYGNVIYHDADRAKSEGRSVAGKLIHFGGDTGVTNIYRQGSLYFYNNTMFVSASSSTVWSMRLFELSTSAQSAVLHNNILHKEGSTNMYMLSGVGTLTFGANNWVTEGWNASAGEGTVVVSEGALLSGASPGLNDLVGGDLTPSQGSPVLTSGAAVPNGSPVEYVPSSEPFVVLERSMYGSGSDLGAFQYSDAVDIPAPPSAPTNLTVRIAP